ncbi:serine/threonine protein phosphatase [Chryseobacterium shigense]|uniref:Serine/threonine protein phosphatase 1 n=1 Tax=Chryseobacterium shigense TaxID=297244 RepID=A0A1N7I7P7_9FLAO|nr:metallophosphoesterase family protein [Chryseobacterium shigense]PQA97070.1 serine/threonine protein phosphatase [Chryseobacterium shigense]SIS33081.1 serine/threonine protein phosphatase 1 [Chryseobacterium shigense]
MNFFIIGDVHGCFYTLEKILTHWNADHEYLIFLGDLIDRGNYSSKVIEKCMKLEKSFPNCIILKGNHEYEFIEYYDKGENLNWTRQCGEKTLNDFNKNKIDHKKTRNWFQSLPLKHETDFLMITHAGISETEDPYNENHDDSVLWNRKDLKNIGKLQVHGHTPLKRNAPLFNDNSNSINIDTGAVYGFGLTGLKVSADSSVIEIINIPTDVRDTMKTFV